MDGSSSEEEDQNELVWIADDEVHACLICTHRFPANKDLLEHLRTAHAPGEHSRVQPCPICDRKFIHMDSLNAHIKHHYVHNMFNCTSCGELFENPSALRRHRAKHSGKTHKPYLLRYQCERCSRSFSYKEDLNRHRKTHIGLPVVYECAPCGDKFSTRPDLIAHQFNRFGEKSHDCNVCNKTILHCDCIENEKRVKCEQCDKTFKNKTQLNNHKRTHDQSRFVNCVYCHAEFEQLQQLREHKCPQANENHTNALLPESGKSVSSPLLDNVAPDIPNVSLSLSQENEHQQQQQRQETSNIDDVTTDLNDDETYANTVVVLATELNDAIEDVACAPDDNYIYKCSYCDEEFAHIDHLQAHFKNVHGSDALYRCDRCACQFTSILDFKIHQCTEMVANVIECDTDINTPVTHYDDHDQVVVASKWLN